MNTKTSASYSLTRLSMGLAALLMAASASAQVNPYEKGPAPTTASLEATAGPFATGTTTVGTPTGFRAGTVYYPTAAGKYGLIVIAPGFTEKQSANTWWATRLASHGFVVVNIDTNTTLDQPESRAKQMMAALKQVGTMSGTASSPYFNKVDTARQGVMGHSMGGGGTLAAARDNPTLKAAMPLAPWHTAKNFTGVNVPTLVIACEDDFIAPIDTHAETFYASLPVTTSRGYLELAGANHFCTNTNNSAAQKAVEGKVGVAWMKRFLDNDTRYTPFISAVPVNATVSQYSTGGSL